jgi:uroporphyrin-III C-methyltransferase
MKIMLFDETPERSLFLRMTLERLGHEIVAGISDSGQLYDAVRKVVRLKGGDPFAFGRGGEETAALNASGIHWEVVSGITAGIAAPAAAGIPITHRDAGRGVAFITGHSRDSAAVDWEALARSGLTLVIYMGIACCESIVAGLREGGLRGDLPAAVIQHATLPQQRIVATTLSRLVADIKHHGIGSPAILVIGEVANAARTA